MEVEVSDLRQLYQEAYGENLSDVAVRGYQDRLVQFFQILDEVDRKMQKGVNNERQASNT